MRPSVTDLRLLPAAVACWVASLVGVRLPTGWVLVVLVVLAVVVSGAAWSVAVGSRRGGRDASGTAPGASGIVTPARDRAPARGRTPALTPVATRVHRWAGRSGGARGQVLLTLVVCAAAVVSAGSQRTVRDAGPLTTLAADRATARVTGTVASEPVLLRSSAPWSDEDRYRVDLDAEHVAGGGLSGPLAASVLVLGGHRWSDVRYGSRVEALGTLQPSAAGDRVAAVLVVRGAPQMLSPPSGLLRRVEGVRHALLAASEDLPPDQRGLVPGSAIGDTSRIPGDLAEAMRVVGLTHITAVSGAHFTIVGAAVLGLVAVAGVPRVLRAGILAVAMAAFVVLVHPTPSVLRAAAMGAVGVWALVLGRPARAIPALAATVLTLLVVDPWLATSIGFALSVVATGGIVLLSRPLAAGLSGVLGDRAARVVGVPLAAQLACGPVVVLLAPALPTYAVPANVLVAPAVVPATILGVLAAVVAPWWSTGGEALARGSGLATWWIAAVARTLASLPGAQVPWPPAPWGPVLLAAATAGVILAVLRLRPAGVPP